ncbi:MAG: Lrp/AsnC family transcriptional regulator [Kiritimatiellaeota bacterium]|nr:Lrp/AsnC family transcriptional regulator [Kiritimatiellota bacterium]
MSNATLTPLDRRILNCIQLGFPLSRHPYTALAETVACTPEEAHARVSYLRQIGIVRRIGGSFAARSLGYISTLVATRVDPSRIEAVAARASSFPEVTHNYEREDDYNLWFTVIAADRERLQAILQSVRDVAGVYALHDLPVRRMFKIKVDFTFGAEKDSDKARPPALSQSAGPPTRLVPDATDRRIIARACGDIGESRTPFRNLAAQVDVAEAEVLARLESYRASGAMRRFGAVLRHRAAGFAGNGMSVWRVPPDDVVRVGEALAACPEISHCYERPRLKDWPYNVFGMIHGKDRTACLSIVDRIAGEIGIPDYRVLFSNREFKKTSMVYFPEALQDLPSGEPDPSCRRERVVPP